MSEKTYGVVMTQTLNIGIGTPLQLQLGGEGMKFKVAGMLVGLAPDEFLIIRLPSYPGILSRLETGISIVGRYVYAGNAYGFNSTILACIQKPGLMVFLTYPPAVEMVNLRKTQRVQCRFPATVKMNGETYKALVVDISLGGCRVCIDSDSSASPSFDVDQAVVLSFYLAGIPEEQVINGCVQNLKKDGQHSEMGIQFNEKNRAVLNNVRLYLDNFAFSTD